MPTESTTNPTDNTPLDGGQVAAGSVDNTSNQGGGQQPSTDINAIIADTLRAQGLPYTNLDDLSKGYKHMQAGFTRSQQENKTVSQQLAEMQAQLQQLNQPAQQPQQPAKYDLGRMGNEDIIKALNEDAAGFISTLVGHAKQEAIKELGGVGETVNNLMRQQSELQVAGAIRSLEQQYGSLDPNYQANLQTAAQAALNDPRYKEVAPAEALSLAYKEVLAMKMTEPEFLQQLTAKGAEFSQQQAAQKMIGAVSTSMSGQQPAGQQPPANQYQPGSIAAATGILGLPNVRVQ